MAKAKTKSKAKKPAKKGAKGGATAKKSAKKSAPKKGPAKKAPAKKAPAKKAPAKKPARKAPAKKPAAKKPPKQPMEAPPMEAPVAIDEGWGDGGDEGGGGPEGGGVQGGGSGHGHGGDIEGGGDLGPLEGASEDDDDGFAASEGPRLADLVGRAMIVQILGDAEAFFFDFAKLSPARRAELIEHHVDAYDRRKHAEGKPNWTEELVPVALLGESMPPAIRGRFDLSAPHEGLVLWHAPSGALLYAASKHDDKLAILAPDLATISPHESFVEEVFDPDRQSYAFAVDRSQSEGFTLAEIETLMQTSGAQLTLV